jgi:hypothetical protein
MDEKGIRQKNEKYGENERDDKLKKNCVGLVQRLPQILFQW